MHPAHPAKIKPLRRHHLHKNKYKKRNLIERCFNKIKQFRHIATRYDRIALNYLAMIKIALPPPMA